MPSYLAKRGTYRIEVKDFPYAEDGDADKWIDIRAGKPYGMTLNEVGAGLVTKIVEVTTPDGNVRQDRRVEYEHRQARTTFLMDCVVDWNLVDEDGTPLPRVRETYAELLNGD